MTEAPTSTRPAMPDEQLQQIIGLSKGVDSIELKLTIPEPAQLTTARALGLDPLQAQLFHDGRANALAELRQRSRPNREELGQRLDDTQPSAHLLVFQPKLEQLSLALQEQARFFPQLVIVARHVRST